MSSRRSVFTAAYAVSVSKCDASMIEILLHGRCRSAGGVTSFHVRPPFERHVIRPSSLPAQMMFSFTYDGARVYTTPDAAPSRALAGVLADVRRHDRVATREVRRDLLPALPARRRLPDRCSSRSRAFADSR
jgi:hypothetical protein